MTDLDEQEACVARLTELRAQFNAIFEIFGNDTALLGERKALAQAKMKSLKERLRTDYKKGDQHLSATQRYFYFPAVHEAYASIHVAYNSRPNEVWLQELFNARSSINLYISKLKE